MNRCSKWKPLLALVLAFSILVGESGLLSYQVYAQEAVIDPVQNEEDTLGLKSQLEQEVIQTETVKESEEVFVSEDLNTEEIVSEKSIDQELKKAQDSEHNEAIEAFHKILADHDLIALVKGTYYVRENPDAGSAVVESIQSGYQVWLLGIEFVENKVWYQVEFAINDTVYYGYIDNENIVTSDSDFLEWKEMYEIDKIFRGRSLLSRTTGMILSSFPESYHTYILALMSAHPNWTFIPFETGLNWDTVISNEMYPTRNLVPMNSMASYKSTNPQFYNTATGTWYPQDSGNWAQASEAAVRYYMDPRNFLNEESVFQFELLTYGAGYTESGVEAILNGTFMSKKILEDNSANGKTYGQVFMELGKSQKVSPYFLASRIRQEQGVSGSELISGKYPGYEGFYNYFNMGATGNNLEQIIVNGLKEAKSAGWTTRYLSLVGGTAKVTEKYIRRGQDTLYLQKFDVDSSYDGLYWHQYMQNLLAADNEGKSIRRVYSALGVLDNEFIFKVPVYNNMPSSAVEKPEESLVQPVLKLDKNSLSSITISWTEEPRAIGYRVYRSQSKNGNYNQVGTVSSVTTTYTESVTPENTYYYKVEAYNDSVSSLSDIITVSTKMSTSAISSAKSSSFVQASLKWKQVAGVTGYCIYRKTGTGGAYKLLKSVNGSSTVSYSDKTLLPNRTYYYKICTFLTVNGKKYYSSYSKEVSVSTSMKAVSLSKVKVKDRKSAVVTWKKSSGVTGYMVYRKTGKGAYKRIKTVKGSTKLSYVDNGVESKKTYYYKVQAYKTVKGKKYYSSYSKQIKIKMK